MFYVFVLVYEIIKFYCKFSLFQQHCHANSEHMNHCFSEHMNHCFVVTGLNINMEEVKEENSPENPVDEEDQQKQETQRGSSS